MSKKLEQFTLLEILREIQSWNNSDLRNIEDISPNTSMLRARQRVIRQAIQLAKPANERRTGARSKQT